METERPIEKLLRAWAKKRRHDAGSPQELHPATRRLLQGEVARTLGKDKPRMKSGSAWFAATWPRVAWGLGVFAVLAAAVWIIMPPSRDFNSERRMAKHESPSTTDALGEKLAAAPADPASPADSFKTPGNQAETGVAVREKEAAERSLSQPSSGTVGRLNMSEQKTGQEKAGSIAPVEANKNLNAPTVRLELADKTKPELPGSVSTQQPMVAAAPAAAPAPSARPSGPAAPRSALSGAATFGGARPPSLAPLQPGSATVVGADLSLATDGLQITQKAGTSGVASATLALAAPTAPAPSRNYFYADNVTNDRTNNVQRFARLDVTTKAKLSKTDNVTSARTVLASFEITRVGSEVRVVDGDGSVYTGYVQPVAEVNRLRKKAQESAASSESLRSAGATAEHSVSAPTGSGPQAGQNYAFRVVGTNRALNESVTFSGQFIAAAEVSKQVTITNSALRGGGAGRATFQEAGTPASAPPPVSSRITGKLTVGTGNEVDVNAVSAGK